jgi:hypothetical protein
MGEKVYQVCKAPLFVILATFSQTVQTIIGNFGHFFPNYLVKSALHR